MVNVPASDRRQRGRRPARRREDTIDTNLMYALWEQIKRDTPTPPRDADTVPPVEETPRACTTSTLESSDRDELLGLPVLPDRLPDERAYSDHVRRSLLELLGGQRNHLSLMTKYHREPERLGAMAVPAGIDAKVLRLQQVNEILSSAIRFLSDGSVAGPTSQTLDARRGLIVQTRDFASRYPHIIVRRTDKFDANTSVPVSSSWSAVRLQNHDASIKANRTLDALGLGLDVLKIVL